MNNSNIYDLAIVGSGLSGMIAAYYVRKKSDKLKIVLIEGKDRIGGRLLNTPKFKYGEHNDTFDLGGEWISKYQAYINWIIEDLHLEIDLQYDVGINVWNFDFLQPNKSYQHCEDFQLTRTNILEKKKLEHGFFARILKNLYFFKVNKVIGYISNYIGNKKYKAKVEDFIIKMESYTISSYILSNFWNRFLLSNKHIQLMEVTHRLLFGCEGRQIPFLYYAHYSIPPTSYPGAGIYSGLLGNNKGQSIYRIKGGAQQICQKILDSFDNNVTVLYNHKVEGITEDKVADDFKITCYHGNEIRSKRIIMAIPPNCLGDISFKTNIPLSPQLISTFARYQPGHVIKFVITYPIAFWRQLGYSGRVINCSKLSAVSHATTFGDNSKRVQATNPNPEDLESKYSYFCSRRNQFVYRGSAVAPFDAIFDSNTPAFIKGSSGSASLCGFIAGDTYMYWREKREEERIVAITTYLSFVWKTTKAREFLRYEEKDWVREELCNGGPVCVPATGFTEQILALREPHDNRIYFAGTESADFDMGTMSGAVQSGLRAAATCLKDSWPAHISPEEVKAVRTFNRFPYSSSAPFFKGGTHTRDSGGIVPKAMTVLNLVRLGLTLALSLNYGIFVYGTPSDHGGTILL